MNPTAPSSPSPSSESSLAFNPPRARTTRRLEPDLDSRWAFDTASTGIGQLAEAYTQAGAVKDYRRVHSYDSLGRPLASKVIGVSLAFKPPRSSTHAPPGARPGQPLGVRHRPHRQPPPVEYDSLVCGIGTPNMLRRVGASELQLSSLLPNLRNFGSVRSLPFL